MKIIQVGPWSGRVLNRWMVFVNGNPTTNGGCVTRRGALHLARRWKRQYEREAATESQREEV